MLMRANACPMSGATHALPIVRLSRDQSPQGPPHPFLWGGVEATKGVARSRSFQLCLGDGGSQDYIPHQRFCCAGREQRRLWRWQRRLTTLESANAITLSRLWSEPTSTPVAVPVDVVVDVWMWLRVAVAVKSVGKFGIQLTRCVCVCL